MLAPIAAATRREKRRLTGESKSGARVGKVIGRYKMAKHFGWSIDERGGLTYRRNASSIAAEAALDGLYVVRTSVPETTLDAPGTVRAYKRLGKDQINPPVAAASPRAVHQMPTVSASMSLMVSVTAVLAHCDCLTSSPPASDR